jgi:hypothetical protein
VVGFYSTQAVSGGTCSRKGNTDVISVGPRAGPDLSDGLSLRLQEADMDWELWGTFSVGDHLRRRAFVADVLLYDRLVIPTPPESDNDEQKRWRQMGWRPERQRRILDLIGKERLIVVPWTQSHRNHWEAMYRKSRSETGVRSPGAVARSQIAEATAADVSRVRNARESFDWKGHKNRGGQPEEIDQLAHVTSREYLVDWSNLKNDTKLFTGLPKVDVDAVAAYGSYAAFSKDYRVEPAKKPSADRILTLFGWQFFVPDDSSRSDEDLLKQALELADRDASKEHRKRFHLWRRDAILSGKTDAQALREMREAIKQYAAAVRKLKIKVASEYGFAVIAAALGAAAVTFPLLGAPAAFAGLGSFALSKSQKDVPDSLKMAAMFHDARKRFGW